jgi:hypothetical protein
MKAARAGGGQVDFVNALVQALLPALIAALNRGGQEQGGQGVATMGATPTRNTTTAAIVIIEITKNH